MRSSPMYPKIAPATVRRSSGGKPSTLTQAAIMQAHQRLPVRRCVKPSWRAADVRAGKIDACLTFERILEEACRDGNALDDVLAMLSPLEMHVRACCALRDHDAPSPCELSIHLAEQAAGAELDAMQFVITRDRSPGTVARFLDACRRQVCATVRLALHYSVETLAHTTRSW